MSQTIAEIIIKYRADTGTSQQALAVKCKTSKATLCRIEKGRQGVSLELLPKLVKATGIPARELRPDLAEMLSPEAA